ncbi:hypothetical protein BDZ45DRAFT_751278 [Acephala macrosclerotiorum]|nr:hypothetical protein BDZ45DRAFT_751278 [Acephala macrosclerotiorum]
MTLQMPPNFFGTTINNGLKQEDLILAASCLWTGTTRASQGYDDPTEKLIGITGPQGTVVLDILRDPIEFTRNGIDHPLLYLVRGPMPTLNRDTRNGYVLASDRGFELTKWTGLDLGNIAVQIQEPVLTLEPDTSSSSSATMICGPEAEEELVHPEFISALDVVKAKHFYVEGRSAAHNASSAAWLLCVAGLAQSISVYVSRSDDDLSKLLLRKGSIVVQHNVIGHLDPQSFTW